MEGNNKDDDEHKGHVNDVKTWSWPDHISVLDLSHRNLTSLNDNVKFPANLIELNLSHNSLVEIPKGVIELKSLKRLDVSFNGILYFDETPHFLHSIEYLNMSKNQLAGPPYWVWSGAPEKLEHLDISCNPNITESFQFNDGYLKELLQYKPLVKEVVLFNCRLHSHLELLETLGKAKVLKVGKADLTRLYANFIDCIPCKGLDKCCDVQNLNLSNTQLTRVEKNINIYKQLQEIDLAHNNINFLPNEFVELERLETCILTGNNLLYLPDNIVQLKCLKHLHLDSNELCLLPEDIGKLTSLKLLDLYDNCLNDVPEGLDNVQELDLAMNYCEEPDSQEYLEKKEKLRSTTENRDDGCKVLVDRSYSPHSRYTMDDEEELENDVDEEPQDPASSNQVEEEYEDWDSDEYWSPSGHIIKVVLPVHSAHPPWYYLIKQKMAEGNFCPMDAHATPVAELVALKRLHDPKVWVEVEGQFDDLTDDDS